MRTSLIQVIEENKALLKQKYDAAKALGVAVNDAKSRITETKALIEQRRIQNSMAGGDPTALDAEEGRCKDVIEQVNAR